MPGEVQVPEHLVEPLTEGIPEVRVPAVVVEPLTEGTPQVKVTELFVEPLTEGTPGVRVSLLFVEALVPVPEEERMSTEKFPGLGNSAANPATPEGADPASGPLPGISYGIHKKPGFKTRTDEAASGPEVRNALQQYPRWNFEFSYEFLEDRTGADSSLKRILGFFLARTGAFDSFLVKDPDDYLVEIGWLADTDGVTTEFPFMRGMGEFYEIIGQVDTVNTITLWYRITETQTIPGSGPFTITVDNAADFVADEGVTLGGVAMTKVAAAPASGEYSVNEGTGVYTFNAADASEDVNITYRFDIDPLDYTVTLPNLVVFDSAPADGLSLVGSFQFFFVCRFLEDELDFEKFADKLWNLQTCEFKSIIQ